MKYFEKMFWLLVVIFLIFHYQSRENILEGKIIEGKSISNDLVKAFSPIEVDLTQYSPYQIYE